MKHHLTKLLRNKDHELYEIWNEYAAESVFFSGKPSKEEVIEIVLKEWWPMPKGILYVSSPEEYVKRWIHVEPLKHVYSAIYER